MNQQRIIIGITGATGFAYGIKALELLKPMNIEVHLIVSKAAQLTRTYETDYSFADVTALADTIHPIDDIGASISSGSFKTKGMLITPCSMRTLAAIASGVTDNLITRAADVALKERRKLVLMTRETPLHLGHIRNMATVTEMGGIICPPSPALYTKPKTLDDIITYSIARTLSLFDIEIPNMPYWRE